MTLFQDSFTVTDLGAMNGVYINREKVCRDDDAPRRMPRRTRRDHRHPLARATNPSPWRGVDLSRNARVAQVAAGVASALRAATAPVVVVGASYRREGLAGVDLEGGGALGALRKFSSMQLTLLALSQSADMSGDRVSRRASEAERGVTAAAPSNGSNAVSLLPVTPGGFFSKADPSEVRLLINEV